MIKILANVLCLLVEVQYHWGYWIRVPYTSKFQSSFSLPPPTTLIGALSYYLAKTGVLKHRYSHVKGEVLIVKEKRKKPDFYSPAFLLEKSAIAVCASLKDGAGFVRDDINKYITLLYQEKIKEKNGTPRRYLMKYRSGAIQCGKVYCPSGRMELIYLFDEEKLKEVIDGNVRNTILEAAWNICRLGSKESIVSVINAQIFRLKYSEVQEGETKTRFYFPAHAVEKVRGRYYTELFWKGGWSRYSIKKGEIEFIEYIIPGTRVPIKSEEVTVNAKRFLTVKDRTVVF